MPHSHNEAGTHEATEGKKQAILGPPKKSARKKKKIPTLYQSETLYGRKSLTERFIVPSFASPHSERKSNALGLGLSLKHNDVHIPEEKAKPSPILMLGTTATTSPITIRTLSQKASPCHRAKYSTDTLPVINKDIRKSLRSSFITASEAITSEVYPPEKTDSDAIAKKTILSPKMSLKVNQIPSVKESVKFYERRVTLQDVEAAEKKSRTQPAKEFGKVPAQAFAYHAKTNDGDTRYEFLHLLAHSFGGDFIRNNIVIGSWAANTIMTLYDHAAKNLLTEKLCEYMDVRIVCTLKSKENGCGFTHHAKEIRLCYKTDDGFIFFSPPINADSIERPTVELGKIITDLVVRAYTAYKTSLGETAENPVSQEVCPLWPPLLIAKPKPQEKPIYVYFPPESKEEDLSKKRKVEQGNGKENASPNGPPALKRKKTGNCPPNKLISSFFPSAGKTENPAPKGLTPLPSSGPF